jgi:calcineurin-like phosphoesterase family protein
MLQQWNEAVSPEDLVYILGDVSFGSPEKSIRITRQLNGRKILIQGNHDIKNLRNPEFRECFEEVHIYHEIDHNGTKVCMFHYPIAEWNQCHRGSVHFYGHVHGNPSGLEQWRALDAGMDATGKVIVELHELFTRAMSKPARGHHGNYKSGDL